MHVQTVYTVQRTYTVSIYLYDIKATLTLSTILSLDESAMSSNTLYCFKCYLHYMMNHDIYSKVMKIPNGKIQWREAPLYIDQ